MRIWFISAYDAPKGNSSRTYDYAKALIERGHEVTFFTSSFDHFSRQERLERGEKFREEYIDGIRVVWLKTIPYYKSTLMRLVNMLSNTWRAYFVGKSLGYDRPDVIVGPSVPLFTGLAAYGLSKKKKCVFCFEVRDIWPQALIDLGVMSEGSAITWGLRKIEKFLYEKADHIVVVLPFAHRHIKKYGIGEGKITWIPNGVDFDRFAECNPYDGGNEHLLRVMYVGRFTVAHNVETIVEAARLVNEQGYAEQIKFTLIGGGETKSHIAKLVGDMKLFNVEVRDPVKKEGIPSLLGTADVLVASVKDTPVYQFGINLNKLYDYFGSGRPVIFSGNSPNDPVKDARAGFSVPPENPGLLAGAIINMHKLPPSKRREMGGRGLTYAREHFDTRNLAIKLESVFNSAVESYR